MPGSNIGNIFGTIRMKNDKLKRDLRESERSIKGFASSSVSSFKKMKVAAIAVGAAVAAIGIARGLRKTISEFVKFEDALLDLQKVMADTEGSAKQFIGTVDELSSKFAEASSEVLQGAANFKQAGFTVVESFKLQEKALTLVRISELGAAESSEILVSILKGFKAPAKDAARLVNVLNAVSNKYATSLGELAKGMALISPIAKLMVFTF